MAMGMIKSAMKTGIICMLSLCSNAGICQTLELGTILERYSKYNECDRKSQIDSLRLKGKRSSTGTYEFCETIFKSGQLKSETKIDQWSIIQTFDGKDGTIINPFDRNQKVQKISEASLDYVQMVELSLFDGLLCEYGREGLAIEYMGKVCMEERTFLKLKLEILMNIVYYFLDVGDYSIHRKEYYIKDNESPVIVIIHEYTFKDGIKFPKIIETRIKNQRASLKTIEDINICYQ